ncbi:hypothetical protein HaLaN_03271, partial [Haematococcus lacustris]
CEIAVVKATDSVPSAHFSSAFCWLLPPLAPPLAQQGLVRQVHPLLAWPASLWHGWAAVPVAQLSGTWPWANCAAADV